MFNKSVFTALLLSLFLTIGCGNSNKAEVNDLNTQIAEFQAQIVTLNQTLDALNNQNVDLSIQISDLKTLRDNLIASGNASDQEIIDLGNIITGLQQQQATELATITSLQEDLFAMKGRVFAYSADGTVSPDWTLVKTKTEQTGFIVLQQENYATHFAVDIRTWDPNTSAGQFLLDHIGNLPLSKDDDLNSEGIHYVSIVLDSGNLDANGNTIFIQTAPSQSPGGPYSFEAGVESQKDLEGLGQKIESIGIDYLRDSLVAEYGLSNERALKVSRLATSYKRINSKRALNAREKDLFTKELIGLSFEEASKTLVDEGYDALVEKASKINETSPEAIKVLINEIL